MEQKDFSSLSNKKLKKLIAETESTLEDLKEELRERKLNKQHKAVDHMEEYFEDAEHNLSNLRLFIQKVIHEIRKGKKKTG